MNAMQIAERAATLLSERREVHGNPTLNHMNIAELWNAWMAVTGRHVDPLTTRDVAVMMALLKLARTATGAHNIDDYVDAAGYAACAGEIAETQSSVEGGAL